MKILHVNTFDQIGGAGKTAYRLFKQEREDGIDAYFLPMKANIGGTHELVVKGKIKQVIREIDTRWERILRLVTCNTTLTPWSTNSQPFSMCDNFLQDESYDVIHLHWINGGFININQLKNLSKPIVWTLHDSWPFTGGCHIPYECTRYENECYDCPQLSGRKFFDLAKWTFNRKQKNYPSNMVIVCPSKWIAECARKSKILGNFDIRVIPNGLDLERYAPRDKMYSRKILNLPQETKVILFGAVDATSDKNKGFHYLQDAMLRVKQLVEKDNIHVVIFGSEEPDKVPDFGFPVHYLGRIYDDITLNIVYSAADVMVVPSMSENFPNTILEAMASGTPCVAFRIGGIPDLVDHDLNGYLAEPFNIEDLAHGIVKLLDSEDRCQQYGKNARQKVETLFDIKKISRAYKMLYEELST